MEKGREDSSSFSSFIILPFVVVSVILEEDMMLSYSAAAVESKQHPTAVVATAMCKIAGRGGYFHNWNVP